MATEYSVWVLHPATGAPLDLIEEYVQLEYVKAANSVGAFLIKVPRSFDMSLIQRDTRIAIYRKPVNGTRALDFVGLVRKIGKQTAGNQLQYYFAGWDLNHLLKRRIVAYYAGETQTAKDDYADDMMKAIVRENLGSGATDYNSDTTRDISAYGFSVQADLSLGTQVEKGFAWRNMLDVLQEIADASHATEATSVYFGVVPLNTGWECEFRTNVGQWGMDHRFPSGAAGAIIFSQEFGNITDAVRETDASDEITYCYAGGQGEEAARTIRVSSDTTRLGQSPFSRIEKFEDARDTDVADAVQDKADSAVRDGRPRDSFSCKLVNTTQHVYGRDYGHGDYVTAVFQGETINCRIEQVKVSVAGWAENVEIALASG